MMPEISKSNVHDDYTPHWIKPSKNYVEVSEAPMAKYISRVLESGQTIFNYDMERKTKFFTYPERRKISMPLGREKKRDDNIIYAKNNDEIKDIKKYKGNKFDVIYAPASGFIAEYLYKEVGHDNTKLVIFDNHSYSLLWKKMIYNLANSEEDINKITQYFKEKYNCHIDNGKIKKNIVEQNEEIFSVTEWLTTIKTISNYEIIKYDVIKEQTFRIDKNKKNLIYLSNIFSYMFNYHKEKIEHLHKKFLEYAILPNSVIIGTNVFKDKIVAINDNIDKSSE
jgi:hypothetical protein